MTLLYSLKHVTRSIPGYNCKSYSTRNANDRSMYKQIWSAIKKASSILVFEAKTKLFELKISVLFEIQVDMNVGNKIELWGHRLIPKKRIAAHLFICRKVVDRRITSNSPKTNTFHIFLYLIIFFRIELMF